MFCISCAAYNQSTSSACSSCGAALRGGSALADSRAADSPHHASRMLAAAVPLVMLVTVASLLFAQFRIEQSSLNAAYARGLSAESLGSYELALSAYGEAGSFKDATQRRNAIEARIMPV